MPVFSARMLWRLALGAMLLLALAGVMQGAEWFSLARLQAQYQDLQAWHTQAPWTVRTAFFVLYLLLASAAIPGIVVLTLAGGAVLGFGWGLLLVSFASSLGATLTLLVVRHVLAESLPAYMGPGMARRLARITRGLEREGVFYLLSLRLIPLVPFGAINVLMGLTRMPAWRFYVFSQLGMLPTTMIYLQAASQLAGLQSVSEVLQPQVVALLIALALALACTPWLTRRALGWLRRRSVGARWKRPARFDYNLIVIGAGAGGLVSAYVAAHAQARVALVEAGEMGGDCLNRGCVPSKALIQSARVAHQVRQAAGFGVQTGAVQVDFAAVMQRVRSIIAAIAPHDSVERYRAMGVEVLQAYAHIVDPWTVELRRSGQAPERISARSIILATGSQPRVPDIAGLQDSGFVTTDTLWDRLEQSGALPRRIAIVGGGPVGCELAQALARLGAQVSLVEAAPALLSQEDADVSEVVQAALRADGVRVFTAHQVLRCETLPVHAGADKLLVLRPCTELPLGGSAAHMAAQVQGDALALPYDLLICATGRKARLSGFGLEDLGISGDALLHTDDYLQTLIPSIYAAGDVVGPYQFTHAAAHQAWYAAVNALLDGWGALRPDYSVLPTAVYIAPEVARVGLNEQQAQARSRAYEVTCFELAGLDRAICDAALGAIPAGFIKVLTVPGRDTLLGVSIVGAHAGELLAPYVLAMRHGLGLKAILSTIHAYPTLSESAKHLAGQWQRAHLPAAAMPWLARWHIWRRG
jgi:pyruvate/2-oxoglutarate dehydrogenase complex dihydrolipoamide dehydrogenase (E3) component/uncharacterized membrane protein YdjX (TVP38/TMEM64 family)